jgi:peptidoglycan/LPS O-acetylase OafA/YrhL
VKDTTIDTVRVVEEDYGAQGLAICLLLLGWAGVVTFGLIWAGTGDGFYGWWMLGCALVMCLAVFFLRGVADWLDEFRQMRESGRQ